MTNLSSNAMGADKQPGGKRFDFLLQKYLARNCSAQELAEFFSYLEQEEYKEILESSMHEDYRSLTPSANTHKIDWDTIYENIIREQNDRKIRRFPFFRLSVAAAIVVILASGLLLLYRRKSGADVQIISSLKQDIPPGSNKAILTLGDGSVISLTDARNGTLAKTGAARINKPADGEITYVMGKDAPHGKVIPELNTISVPQGGTFTVTLPDKSKVWLNSESSLSYPTAFTGGKREVTVSGEAYFEIAGDKAQPFFVRNGTSVVEVLGTSFNLMSYPESREAELTLSSGSVRLITGVSRTILKPGQQAAFSPSGGRVTLRAVDPDDALDWKNGYFLFDNDGIEDVMNKIKRWYATAIEYEGTKPDISFTGMISRNNNVSKVLSLLERSGGVRFEISDKKIIVKAADKL